MKLGGIAGDQQAALFRADVHVARAHEEHARHRLFHAAEHRHVGAESKHKLLTTVAWTSDGTTE